MWPVVAKGGEGPSVVERNPHPDRGARGAGLKDRQVLEGGGAGQDDGEAKGVRVCVPMAAGDGESVGGALGEGVAKGVNGLVGTTVPTAVRVWGQIEGGSSGGALHKLGIIQNLQQTKIG